MNDELTRWFATIFTGDSVFIESGFDGIEFVRTPTGAVLTRTYKWDHSTGQWRSPDQYKEVT